MNITCAEQPWFAMDGVNLPEIDERVCLQKNNSPLSTMGYLGRDGHWHNSSGKSIPSHIVTGWRYTYWAAN
jgi:hypothetical protein